MKGGPNALFPGPNIGKPPVPLVNTPNGGVEAEDTNEWDGPPTVDGVDVAANIVARNGFAAPRTPVA